jgi:hypothetical protein
VDSTLAYIDQASFLALRALGRAPLAQFNWLYEHPLDLAALQQFQANLARGFLGRRIERAALPFGRHRWVVSPPPPPIVVAETPCSRDEVGDWLDERVRVPVDPEWGPGFHIAVRPLVGGGAVVSMVVSHSISDGIGLMRSISDAAQGIVRDFDYPRARSRSRTQALRAEASQTLRELPQIGKAVAATVRVARTRGDDLVTSARMVAPEAATRRPDYAPGTFFVPEVTVFVDLDHWDECARRLGGTSNALFAGFSARLGRRLDRVEGDGLVTLSYPVSERTEHDIRANALTQVMFRVDPDGATADLSGIRTEMKKSLSALNEKPYELLAPLPLTPFTPRRLVRRLERMALGAGRPVGCSNLGDIDPWMNRLDGSEADYYWFRMVEYGITPEILDCLGGQLFMGSGRIHGRVFLHISGWRVGGPNTIESLRHLVETTMDEFELSGRIERL